MQHIQEGPESPAPAEETEGLWHQQGSSRDFLYASYVGGESSTDRDRKKLNNLVKRADSVLDCRLDSIEEVVDRRMLTFIKSNSSHPLHHTVEALGSTFSTRLRHYQCRKECYHRSFLPTAITQSTSFATSAFFMCNNYVQYGHNSCTARYLCVRLDTLYFLFFSFFQSFIVLMYAAAGTLPFPHCGIIKNIFYSIVAHWYVIIFPQSLKTLKSACFSYMVPALHAFGSFISLY